MTKRRLSRRALLRGIAASGGAVTLGLPLLEIMMNDHGDALADGGGLPRRFGLWWWGNGNRPDSWDPLGVGADYVLSDQCMNLAPVRDRVSFVTGLEVKVPNENPHGSGPAGMLTGLPELTGSGSGYATATFDQTIADNMPTTRRRSMQSGVLGGSVTAEGPSSPLGSTTDPFQLYAEVFGDDFQPYVPLEPGEEPARDARLLYRRSVLDAITEDARRLQSRVGVADRLRVQQHMDNIRGLELALADLYENPPQYEACAYIDEPNAALLTGTPTETMFEINRANAKIMAMALACDQTRVFTHVWSNPVNGTRYLDHVEGHHDLTHFEGGDQPSVYECTQEIMRGLSDFILELDAVEEGDGTLLDNILMLATSEISEGKAHAIDRMPVILAGGACGDVKEGVHIAAAPGTNMSDLMLTIGRIMGLPLEGYGTDSTYTEREISEIRSDA